MNHLLSVLREFLWRHLGLLAVSWSLDVLANVLWLTLSVIVAQTYALLFGFSSFRGQLLSWRYFPDDFQGWLLVLGALAVIRAAADYGRHFIRGRLSERLLYVLRQHLFEHQIQLSTVDYEAKGVGRYLLRFSGDLSGVQSFISKGVLRFTSDLFIVALGVIIIFGLDFVLGSLVVGALLILGLCLLAINRQIGEIEEERRNQKSSLLVFVSDRLLNIKTVKALNRGGQEAALFERKTKRLHSLGTRHAHWAALSEAIIPLGLYLVLGAALLFVAWLRASSPGFDMVRVFAAILVLLSWRGILMRFFRVGSIWKMGRISLRKMGMLFDRQTDFNTDKVEKSLRKGELYVNCPKLPFLDAQAFSALDFRLRAGQTLLIEGASGTGKTVLTKLLAGLYMPTGGCVEIGGCDIREVHPKMWRRHMAFISDDFPLYGRHVGDAVLYTNKAQHRQEAECLWEDWCALFPVLDRIDRSQPIHSGAPALSPCQASLMQWMRAFLSHKPIIVADEPFRGMDEEMISALLAYIRARKPSLALLLLVQPGRLAAIAGGAQRARLGGAHLRKPLKELFIKTSA